jgi:putative transposase
VQAYRANALFDAHTDDPEFGYRYLVEEARAAGEPMAERTAWRICSKHRLWSAFGKIRRGKNAKAGPPVHDGLVKRVFTAEALNQLWLSDISERRTGEGKLYMCAIKDGFSNRIVGYSIDSRMKSRLATAALNNAIARRGQVPGCIVHADRGSQFRSRKFVHALVRHDMSALWDVSGGRRQRRHGELLQSAAEERAGSPPLGYPRRAQDRHRHLDRTHLPPPSPASRPRKVDPHRIRSNRDYTGQPGRVKETVTYPCSRPDVWSANSLITLRWLQTAERVLYWGDIDRAGLQIVASLRRLRIQIQPILMDCATMDTHRDHAHKALKIQAAELTVPEGLTADETLLYERLNTHYARTGEEWQLEQEHLPAHTVESALAAACRYCVDVAE